MSGLVSTYSAWSRAQSRSSREESPSWVAARRTARPSARRPVQLVLGERLGGGEVERAGAALPAAATRRPRSRSGPAAGSPATCPRPCRWRPRRAARRAPSSAAATWWRQGRSTPLAAKAATQRRRTTQAGQSASARRARGQHLEVGQPVLAPRERGQPVAPGARTGSVPCRRSSSSPVQSSQTVADTADRRASSRCVTSTVAWFDDRRHRAPPRAAGHTTSGRDRGSDARDRTGRGRTIIEVGGEIDVYTAPQLRDKITELVADGRHTTSSSTWRTSTSSTPPGSASWSVA